MIISIGDVLREAAKDPKSPIGEWLAKGNKVVPSHITVSLLLQEIRKEESKRIGEEVFFLIDGYPRNKENYEQWKQIVGDKARVHGYLCLSCSIKVMEARLQERRDKSSARSDDKPEVLKNR